MANRTINTRFFWPAACDTCKRIPLIHVTYTVTTGRGYEWEDSLSYTYCPICILKDKVHSFVRTSKAYTHNLFTLSLPLFFQLIYKGKSVSKSWKLASKFLQLRWLD